MKQFFKMTLATICGIAIFLLITLLFFVISFAGMLASDTASTKVKENSVFVIKLNGTISERAESESPVDGTVVVQVDVISDGDHIVGSLVIQVGVSDDPLAALLEVLQRVAQLLG